MAKPNYSFEKRQRELAKKRKQEEKDARKRSARTDPEPSPASIESASIREPEAAAPAGPRIHRRTTQTKDETQ